MAKKDYTKNIETLERSLSCYSVKKEALSSYHLKLLSGAYGLYLGYYEALFNTPTDPRIEDVYSFHEFIDTEAELKPLIAKLRELNTPVETERQKSPDKEESTIPQDLEGLVAQYRENQADKLLNVDNPDSVEALVKRARQTWETRHRIELIQRNLEEAQKKSDKFFANNIDPKSGDREVSYQQINYVISKVLQAKAAKLDITLTDQELRRSINDVSELVTAGAIEIDDLYALNLSSELAFRNLEGKIFFSPVSKVDLDNPYKADPQYNDKTAGEYYRETTKELSNDLISTDLDFFDEKVPAAKKKINDIQHNLETAIPDAKKPNTPLQDHAAELQTAIRQADPTLLNINPTAPAVRTAAVLETTHSQSREVSPEVVVLSGLGLTPEKFSKLEEFAKSEKGANTPLGELRRNQPDVFDQVHSQLKNLHNSKLAQEIEPKAISGISANFNKLSPRIQGIARVVIDPVGTARNWINRKIGENIGKELIKNTSSALAQKIGSYLIKDGLENGVKALVADSTKKIVLEAAKKIGFSIAGDSLAAGLGAWLSIPTAGASLLIAAAFIAVQETFKATFGVVQKIAKSAFGEEIKTQDLAAVGGIILSGAFVAGASVFGGIRLVGAATKTAFISALGILLITVTVIGLYLGMIFMVAPILSTLVQLDSVEKVDYSKFATSSGGLLTGCINWPTKGHYLLIQGEDGLGCTHNKNHLQAADILAPEGSDFVAVAPGTVTFAGVMGTYGNAAIINSTTGNGTADVLYAHMTEINVGAGQHVQAGDTVGLVGGTGGWKAHIHYEFLGGFRFHDCQPPNVVIPDQCCNNTPPAVQCQYNGANIYSN